MCGRHPAGPSDDNGSMPRIQLAYWTEAGVVDAVLHPLDRAHTHLDKGSDNLARMQTKDLGLWTGRLENFVSKQ